MAVPHNLKPVSRDDLKYCIDYFGLRRNFPLPAWFTLNLTHRCNLACDMCTQYGGDYKSNKSVELTAVQWENFIKSVAWIKPKFTLFGGEPLLHPEIREIFKIVDKYKCPTTMVTNGSFLEEYLDDIMKYNITVFISIDGPEETHNRVRNSKDSFQRIVKALDKMKEAGYKNFGINSVLLPDNLYEVANLLDFLIPYEPSIVVFQHLQFTNPSLDSLCKSAWQKHFNLDYTANLTPKKKIEITPDYINELTYVTETIKNGYGSKIPIAFMPGLTQDEISRYYSDYEHFLLRPESVCMKPWRQPTINTNGDVHVCLDYKIGNINEQNFWEIWESEAANKFRKTLSIVEKFPICTRCCDFYGNNEGA
ncbi:MAG: radical SAM protein [Clostridia bacterium]|nr:radical SAM protein [Clostridia bacterium]